MNKELVLTAAVNGKLVEYSRFHAPNEAAAIIGCGMSSSPEHCRLLGKHLFLPTAEDYAEQTPYSVRETPGWMQRTLRFCAQHSLHPFLYHTHPFAGSPVEESAQDRRSAAETCAAVTAACPGMAVGTMVMNPSGTSLDAHLYNVRSHLREPIDVVTVPLLHHHKMIYPTSSRHRHDGFGDDQFWSRTRLVFGQECVRNNANIHVAIVGVGGLGEPIAVMLANLGIGVTLVDMDTFCEHNVNRSWFGNVNDAKLGKAKVDVVRAAVLQTDPSARVRVIRGDVRDVGVQRRIASCHGLVVAVDNVAARFVCSQLAMAHGLFLFDVGTEIDVTDGKVSSVRGQVVKLVPGTNLCHHCARFFNPVDARQGLLSEADLKIERSRGYVRGADMVAPSVIAVNAVLASTCVWEIMRYLSGVTNTLHPDVLTLDLLKGTAQAHDYERNRDGQRVSCPICSGDGYLFEGDRAPLLHQYDKDSGSLLTRIALREPHGRTDSSQHPTGQA